MQETDRRRRQFARLAEAQAKAVREKVKPKEKESVEKPEEAPKTRAGELFQGQNHPKKMREIVTIEQWAEITVEDGKTVTQVMPSNEMLIEEGKAMLPPPELVYRRLNFVNGVPPEYHWTTKRRQEICPGLRNAADAIAKCAQGTGRSWRQGTDEMG